MINKLGLFKSFGKIFRSKDKLGKGEYLNIDKEAGKVSLGKEFYIWPNSIPCLNVSEYRIVAEEIEEKCYSIDNDIGCYYEEFATKKILTREEVRPIVLEALDNLPLMEENMISTSEEVTAKA
ncbi:MAG: hypothetical protein KJ906_01515 [Nanoarchaeota archaeon]|nr:hypothetical protein [Nanoarchaeota archaeon]